MKSLLDSSCAELDVFPLFRPQSQHIRYPPTSHLHVPVQVTILYPVSTKQVVDRYGVPTTSSPTITCCRAVRASPPRGLIGISDHPKGTDYTSAFVNLSPFLVLMAPRCRQ